MKRITRLLPALLLATLCTITVEHAVAAQKKLYTVIFEATGDSNGKLVSLKVAEILDASSGSKEPVSIQLPEVFMAAAKERLSTKLLPTSQKTVYTYLFYDPDQPTRTDIDPKKEEAAIESFDQKKFEEFCKTAPCRKNFEAKLQLKDGTLIHRIYQFLPPVVGPSLVSIYTGETLYIEADATEAGLSNFVHVDKITKPEKTITLYLCQCNVPGQGLAMLLTVTSPFSKPIRYDATITTVKNGKDNQLQERQIKSPTCPITSDKSGKEVWHDPISMILLENFRFIKAGESMSCD